mmetsp:Transcript_5166/g.15540  ORF Transcript_5166/g.15540 Transcript_5166/m.15540 type:complete len:618 (-) Transcript_5166:196-2049(-)
MLHVPPVLVMGRNNRGKVPADPVVEPLVPHSVLLHPVLEVLVLNVNVNRVPDELAALAIAPDQTDIEALVHRGRLGLPWNGLLLLGPLAGGRLSSLGEMRVVVNSQATLWGLEGVEHGRIASFGPPPVVLPGHRAQHVCQNIFQDDELVVALGLVRSAQRLLELLLAQLDEVLEHPLPVPRSLELVPGDHRLQRSSLGRPFLVRDVDEPQDVRVGPHGPPSLAVSREGPRACNLLDPAAVHKESCDPSVHGLGRNAEPDVDLLGRNVAKLHTVIALEFRPDNGLVDGSDDTERVLAVIEGLAPMERDDLPIRGLLRDVHSQSRASQESLKVQLDLLGDLAGREGLVHPLFVEILKVNRRPRGLDGRGLLRHLLHGEAFHLPPPERDLHGVVELAGLRLNRQGLAAGAKSLHAKPILAVQERHPPLLGLSHVQHHPLKHLLGHASAVIHHPDRLVLLAHEDVDLDAALVIPEALITGQVLALARRVPLVVRLRVVYRIVHELHENPRRARVPLRHVVQEERRATDGELELLPPGPGALRHGGRKLDPSRRVRRVQGKRRRPRASPSLRRRRGRRRRPLVVPQRSTETLGPLPKHTKRRRTAVLGPHAHRRAPPRHGLA